MTEPSLKNRTRLVQLALIIAVLIVYGQTVRFGFVDFDDPEYVRDNARVVAGLNGDGVAWAFTTNYVVNWHPMTWLSLMLDSDIYRELRPALSSVLAYDDKGRSPGGYHLTNVLLHAANVLLLFGLLRSMTGAFWPSAFVAGLLAVHPLHVESVAWISERKDVLSMLFLLLTIWGYVWYVRRPEMRTYLLVVAMFSLGLMSKPMLVTLPFGLLLLDYWPLKRRGARLLVIEKVPLIAMAAASSIVTYMVQQGTHALQDGVWMSPMVRLANSVVSYVRYIGKMFWPLDLAPLYPNPSHIGKEFWEAWQVAGAAALLVAITVAAFALRRKRPYLIVGWLWFLGTLAPVIGLVQIGRHAMADRYAYVPLLGLYIVIAWSAVDMTVRLKHRRIVLAVLAAMILAALTVIATLQTRHWKNSIALFEHTLQVTDGNWLIHNNLAAVLERENKSDEAIAHLRQALEIYPECAWIHDHLGAVYTAQRDLFKAQKSFEEAVRHDPNFAKAHYNLGVVLTNRGGQDGLALLHFQRAVELKPNDFDSRRGMALTLAKLGRMAEGIEALKTGKQLQPKRAADYDALIQQLPLMR